MRWTDDVVIETPEQIDVALELAGVGTRFLARVVDWAYKGLILIGLALFCVLVGGLLGLSMGKELSSMLVLAVAVGLAFAVLLGYDLYFEFEHNGQTPGKKHAGIRVIREGGAPLDMRSALVRNLLRLADMLPFAYLGGVLLILLTKRSQRLGDLAAGTVVIRERHLTTPSDVAAGIVQWASPEVVFTAAQLSACAPSVRTVLRSFFQRFATMSAHSRETLGRRLADEFRRQMAVPPAIEGTPGEDAVVFLASLYRDMEEVARQGRAR
jgi:uncharacterized RDD family membrane protein YckC